MKPAVLAIVGPTASGKTALAVAAARALNGEVVSADSRQVYRGMDIGAGKVSRREMRGVPHHLLDVASPKRVFSAARYRKLGRAAIQKILKRGKLPIVAGGTGFYLDALLYDRLLPEVPPDPKIRAKLKKESAAALFARLRRLDPRRAAAIDRFNKRRLVRALEIIRATKKPVPPRGGGKSAQKSPYRVTAIGLAPEPEALRKNIRDRLTRRLRAGMLRETERLHELGVTWRRLDELGLEYRAASRCLRGLIGREEMSRALERDIRRYAKRQMTWFRRNPAIRWFKTPEAALRHIKKEKLLQKYNRRRQ